jgi:hypothetical protein
MESVRSTVDADSGQNKGFKRDPRYCCYFDRYFERYSAVFLQMLHILFYGLPLLGSFVYGLLKPGCTWMPDWTMFFSGALIQVRPKI